MPVIFSFNSYNKKPTFVNVKKKEKRAISILLKVEGTKKACWYKIQSTYKVHEGQNVQNLQTSLQSSVAKRSRKVFMIGKVNLTDLGSAVTAIKKHPDIFALKSHVTELIKIKDPTQQ